MADVRHQLTIMIRFYLEMMRDRSRSTEHRLSCAQLAALALFGYLKLLDSTEMELELRQMQRILAELRKPADD